MSRVTQLRTYARLGPAYRLGLKSGWHPAQRLTASVAPLFGALEEKLVASD